MGTTSLFASGGETDLVQRAVNFAIFAGLSYYLFAGFIKNFFGQRSSAIATQFERAQDKAKAAKVAKEEANKLLQEAKLKADEIVASAKDEAVLLVKKIKERKDDEIKILNKLKDETKLVMENKMVRSVVSETMSDILDSDELLADQSGVVQNMIKRVA